GSDMRLLLVIGLSLVLTSLSAIAGTSSLEKIGEEAKYDSGGRSTGVLIEYKAEKKDFEASYGWEPDKKPPLLSFDKILERAKGYVEISDGNAGRVHYVICGADLRRM